MNDKDYLFQDMQATKLIRKQALPESPQLFTSYLLSRKHGKINFVIRFRASD